VDVRLNASNFRGRRFGDAPSKEMTGLGDARNGAYPSTAKPSQDKDSSLAHQAATARQILGVLPLLGS
jgi:hypothetical protein